jgi:hypothetical protein
LVTQDGAFKKTVRVVVCPKECFDLGPELGVAGTGMIQESRPLARRTFFDGGREEGFFIHGSALETERPVVGRAT